MRRDLPDFAQRIIKCQQRKISTILTSISPTIASTKITPNSKMEVMPLARVESVA
jgi:hypothetical protein